MMEGEYISSDGGGGETVSTQASDEEGRECLSLGDRGERRLGAQAGDEEDKNDKVS